MPNRQLDKQRFEQYLADLHAKVNVMTRSSADAKYASLFLAGQGMREDLIEWVIPQIPQEAFDEMVFEGLAINVTRKNRARKAYKREKARVERSTVKCECNACHPA